MICGHGEHMGVAGILTPGLPLVNAPLRCGPLFPPTDLFGTVLSICLVVIHGGEYMATRHRKKLPYETVSYSHPVFRPYTMALGGTVNLTCDGRRSSNFHLVCDAVLAQSWLHHAPGANENCGNSFRV